MITIRTENSKDYEKVFEIHSRAFNRLKEAELVKRIRLSEGFLPELSLVALYNNELAGHILFSVILVENDKDKYEALALSALAVLPELQNRGIGSELIRQGLERCRQKGFLFVVVLGLPDFYPRFGFQTARFNGIHPPFPVPDEVFMVNPLKEGILDNISGVVRYSSAFSKV